MEKLAAQAAVGAAKVTHKILQAVLELLVKETAVAKDQALPQAKKEVVVVEAEQVLRVATLITV
jgi:hypothetical protein